MHRRRRCLSGLAVALLAAALPLEAAAQQQTLRFRAYIHSVYADHDGAPIGSVSKILQTPEGYLWVFTQDGLLRFDGKRFVRPSTPCTEPIQSQAAAPDGGFWAVCGQKLIRRTADARFVVVSQALPKDLPKHILFADREGRVWILGPTIRYLGPDGGAGHVFESPRAPQAFAAAQDSEGTIWATDGSSIFHLSADRIDPVSVLGAAYCITPSGTGGVLISTGTSVLRLRRGAEPSVIASFPEQTINNALEGCMREATNGALWIAKAETSVAVVSNGVVEVPAGIVPSYRMVNDILIDREGLIWTGTPKELNLFRKPESQFMLLPSEPVERKFVFLDSRTDLWTGSASGARRSDLKDSTEHFVTPALDYGAIGEDEQGIIWLATPTTIGRVIGGKFVAVSDAAGRPVSNVKSFRQDRLGHLWALAQGAGVFQVTPGAPRLIAKSTTASAPFLVSERRGIWTSTADGGLEQYRDGQTTTLPALNHDSRNRPTAILEDGDSIWIGSASAVDRFRNGRRTRWTSDQGLPTGSVRAMVADESGHLWMLIGGAFHRFVRADLDATPDGQPRALSSVRVETLGAGVLLPAGLRNVPAATSDRNGRIYGFTSKDAVVIVNPDAMKERSMMPASILETVLVDSEPVDHTVTSVFVDPSRLDFEYTAINLRGAESTRFRYRLEGYDAEWVDARTQRAAVYRNLRPGAYRFHLMAQGPEGVWNQTGTSFAFRVVPVFWRTWWFQISVVAVGLSMLVVMFRFRVRQLTRQFNLGLEARVSERTRIARDLHDTLLQSFQGVLIHFHAATNLLPGRPDDARRKLESILEQAERAVTEGREAVQALRGAHVASEDLPDALTILAGQLRGDNDPDSATAMFLNVEGTPRPLRAIVRDDVYRIASEAMRNAVRHAQAHAIQVDIHYDQRHFQIRIRDDGIGIDTAVLEAHGISGHWGLPGMRERAELIGGTLDVRSRMGSGTEIDLSLPASKAYMPAADRRLWSGWRRSETDS